MLHYRHDSCNEKCTGNIFVDDNRISKIFVDEKVTGTFFIDENPNDRLFATKILPQWFCVEW